MPLVVKNRDKRTGFPINKPLFEQIFFLVAVLPVLGLNRLTNQTAR